MDLTQLANLGEFIGGVAVLVTLVYLATQVRQNQRQMAYIAEQTRQEASAATSSAMGSWLTDYNNLVIALIQDAELTQIFREGISDFDGLDGNSQMRFHGWIAAHILNAQNLFLELKEGTILPNLANPVLGFNARMLRSPGAHQWWETSRNIFDPNFIAHMDGLMESVQPISQDWPWFAAEGVA